MQRFDHYKKKVNLKKVFKDILIIYIISVFFVFIFNSLFLQAFDIHSNSMEPQIKNNTLIIVNKYIYGPKFPFTEKRIFDATRSIKRGDVVLVMSQEYYKTNVLYRALSKLINTLTFTLIDIPSMMENKEESIYIKRVIGIPGDKIRFKYINGKVEVFINDILEKYAIDKKYITIDDDDRYPLISEIKMNKDEYFIMGDNRKESSDSRIWGAVKSNQIIGKAILIYHPYLGVIK